MERQNLSFKRPRTDFNHARLCSLVTLGPSECHWRNSSPHWREFHLPENMKMGKIQPIISEYTMSDQIGSWYLVKRPKQLRRMLRPSSMEVCCTRFSFASAVLAARDRSLYPSASRAPSPSSWSRSKRSLAWPCTAAKESRCQRKPTSEANCAIILPVSSLLLSRCGI